MKAAISRFVVGAAVLALMSVGTPLFAQISFPNFSNTSGLTLNPSAAQAGNVLRLTPALPTQAGSAWFNTQQTVTGTFSTTFQFQISGANTNLFECTPINGFCPADGFAFVIQNSVAGTAALGPAGCSIGFGNNAACQGAGSGISNSLAVEFDTFSNAAQDLNSANHVAIQSCPNAGQNSTDLTAGCTLGNNANLPVTLADGNTHTVTISYSGGRLDVILDNHDLFPAVTGEGAHPAGVAFDFSTLGLNNGTAYVGFTAATGGANDNHDILNWTFSPDTQSGALPAVGVPAILNFQGGPQNNAYDYTAVLTGGGVTSATVQIKQILIAKKDCEKLVQKNFPFTQCFRYQNAAPGVDSSVMFELTCPGSATGGTCGDSGTQNFFADLGSDFTFTKAENPGFQLLAATIGPYPGWLKGSGPDPLHPCTPFTSNSPALFQSNQITSFSVVGDPLGTTKGKSGGGGSCWVATYATFGELPPGIKITTPTFTTYTQNQSVTASYSCSDPATSKAPSNPKGPYLTVPLSGCTQNQAPNVPSNDNSCTQASGKVNCTGPLNTSVLGLHVFQVTAKDSGGNVNVNLVIYNVKH